MAKKPTATLSSMTGFGRAQVETNQLSVKVEFRTVNGKGFHCKLRMPSDLLEHEAKVEGMLRQALSRGSISGFVSVRRSHDETVEFDQQVLKNYLAAWKRTEKNLGLDVVSPTLKDLISMPGAMHSARNPQGQLRAVERVIKQAAAEAIVALQDSRAKEGVRLAKEMQRIISQLEKLVARTARRAPAAVKEVSAKYELRVQHALAAAGENDSYDLGRELIALAERADVQEEIARLEIHIARLRATIKKGGAVGREFEFILQECHREITTLGNKSSDSKLSEMVVAMKLCAQQLKEQIANVE
ncbi:MAG: YicC family protein [Planctomycetota bacterium]|nr:YicC family protein [Planctomycetota bacterium]